LGEHSTEFKEKATMPEFSFSAIDLSDQDLPEAICAECAMRDGVLYSSLKTVIVFCPHSSTGAYRVLDRPWKTIPGVDATAFIRIIARGLTQSELTFDLASDLKRMLEQAQTRH
jgi:hypothetical protein